MIYLIVFAIIAILLIIAKFKLDHSKIKALQADLSVKEALLEKNERESRARRDYLLRVKLNIDHADQLKTKIKEATTDEEIENIMALIDADNDSVV